MNTKFIFLALFILLLSTYYIGKNSVNVLDLRLSPQKMDKWCWVASVEMIQNYTKDYINIIKQVDLIPKSNECFSPTLDCIKDTDVLTSNCRSFNTLIQSPDFKMFLDRQPFNYEFQSDILDYSKIKTQIDLKKPFIVGNIVQTRGRELWAQHYFVGFGYLNTYDKQWVFVRDPWSTCDGCTYAISYKAMKEGGENISRKYKIQTPNTYFNFRKKNLFIDNDFFLVKEKYFRFKEYLVDIKHILQRGFKDSSKISEINKHQVSKFLIDSFDNISDSELKQLGLSEKLLNNFQVSETYLEKKIVLYPEINKFELAKIITIPDATIAVVNVLEEDGTPVCEITLYKNGDYWEVSKFASCPWLPFAKAVAKSKTETHLSKIDFSKVIEKEHLTLLPTQYQFYKVEYEGIIYYYPRNNYPDIQNTFYTQATFAYEIAPKIAKEYYQKLFSSKLPEVLPSKYSIKPTSSPKPSPPLPKLN